MKKNNIISRSSFCISLLLPALVSISGQSLAEAENVLEEVIVTAQKREQPLQDVPIAVTVFSGKDIQQSGAKDLFDLQMNAPGLVVGANQSATTSNFSIRGIGTSSQNFGLESSVGLYVDGVYRARQSSMINDLVDIDWIEVLRGPQGTLFGRNTPAGAISINTIKPDVNQNGVNGFAEATVGNYGLTNLNAAMSVTAIPEMLGFRATVFSSHRDGWMDDISLDKDNAVNDRNRYGARLQSLYLPNEDIEIRVIADYAEIDEICCGTSVVLDNNERDQRREDTSDYPLGTDSILESRGGTFVSGDRTFDKITAYSQLPESTNDDGGLSVQVDWTLDTSIVTSVTAWRQFNSFDNIDSDFTDLDALVITNDAEQSSFSQELRISGLTELLSYVAGFYYFNQDIDSIQQIHTGVDTAAVASINQEFSVPDSWFPADGFATTKNQQDHESWALFGQIDLPITDRVYLVAGLRYSDENKKLEAQYTETNAGAGFAFFPPLAPRGDISTKIDDEEVTGTIKLSWAALDDILLYASYGTGYKSGGTNTDRIPEDFKTEFGPETSEAFELGVKADFPDQALRLNAALHRTDFDDLQVNTFNGTGFNLRNAATAETYGAEIELLWQPSSTMVVTAAYAHTIANFGDFEYGNCWIASPFRGTPDPGGDGTLEADFCARDGDRIGANPEDYLVLTLRKDFMLSDDISGFAMGEYSYTGDQIMDSSNDPYEFQDSYNMLNLRLGLRLINTGTEFTLWGRNVTDTEYYGTNFDPPLQDGKLNAYARDPATYGLTIRQSF